MSLGGLNLQWSMVFHLGTSGCFSCSKWWMVMLRFPYHGWALRRGFTAVFDVGMTLKWRANTSMSDGLLTIALIPHMPF